MRFACGTTSWYADSSSTVQLKTPKSSATTDRKGKTAARTVDRDRKARLSDARNAVKKDVKQHKRVRIHGQSKKVQDVNYVFVGNLLPSITQPRLYDHFKTCGKISKITIRCSRGQAVNIDIPGENRTPRDRHYAAIEFVSSRSAKSALAFDSTMLDNCRLVVASSATELPEVSEILKQSTERINSQVVSNLVNSTPKTPKPLVAQDTEQIIDFRAPNSDRIRIFGFSFAKGLL